MKKVILSFIAISMSASFSYAGRVQLPSERGQSNTIVTEDGGTVTMTRNENGDIVPSYQMPAYGVSSSDTIQDAAKKSAKTNKTGETLGTVAMGVTLVGSAMACSTQLTGTCPYWLAGLAASVYVTGEMKAKKNQSMATAAAVTVGDGSSYGKASDVRPSYSDSPQMEEAKAMIKKMENKGFKFDLANGKVTGPNGKTYDSSMLGNSSGMAGAGFSPKEMSLANQMKKALEGATKASAAADGSDMFGDSVGGGGGTAAAKGAEGGGLDGMTAGLQNPGLGEDGRGPAQVAGLAKNLDGTPIGISQDNLFTMIGKRYQWCSDKGCFLPQVKP